MCRQHNHGVAKIEHVNICMRWMENWRNHLILSSTIRVVQQLKKQRMSIQRYQEYTNLRTKKLQTLKISNKYTVLYLVYSDDTLCYQIDKQKWYYLISIRQEKLKWWIYIFVMNKQARFTAKHHYLYLNVFCFCVATKTGVTMKKLDTINKALRNWNQRPNLLGSENSGGARGIIICSENFQSRVI